MNTKRTLLLLAAGCGCVALGIQAPQKKYVILDDKKGEFKIYDVESFEGMFNPSGNYGFTAQGSPLRGYSKQQGLTFSMVSLKGTASRTADGSFRIQDAQAAKDVVAQIEQANSDGSNARSHVSTQAMNLREGATETTITFPSAFTFANRIVSETVDRLIEIRAPGGTFVLPLLDRASGTNNPLRSADVKGPVNIVVDSRKKGPKGTTVQVLKVRGDSLTYDGPTRTLTLVGNVSGDVEQTMEDGKTFSFASEGQAVTIELDEDSAVKNFTFKAGKVASKGGGD